MQKTPKAEGLRWLEQAEEDLKWADLLTREGGYQIACFLAQQVAEKAMKAFQGESIVLGHSVERLCVKAPKYDQRLDEKCKPWALLDAYYVPTRYPNSLPESIPARVYTKPAAEASVRLAGEAVEFVARRLKPSAAERPTMSRLMTAKRSPLVVDGCNHCG